MSKYSFETLEVEQEIQIEGDRNKIASYASTYGKRTGKKFSVKGKNGTFVVKRLA